MIIYEPAKPAFQSQAFDWLERIARTPTASFYLTHKSEFLRYVEQPLQRVLRREAQLLPQMMRDLLETRRNLFSRFLKNDFGHGGAWSNYWGAFYPRGSRRIMDLQLAIWMDYRRLGISFYISEKAGPTRLRFSRNCSRWRGELAQILEMLLGNHPIQLALEGKVTDDGTGRMVSESPLTWDAWLEDPAKGDYWAFLPLTPKEVTSMPEETLAAMASEVHSALFPLVLAAMQENPLPLIQSYLGQGLLD